MRERGGSVIYMGHFVWVFVYPQAITWFLFPDLTYARTLPDMQAHFFFPKMDSSPEVYGGHHLLWGGAPSFFTTREPVCAMSPLSQGWEVSDLLVL